MLDCPNFQFDVSGLTCTKWWTSQFTMAAFTGSWLILQALCADIFGAFFSWGVSFAIVSVIFSCFEMDQFKQWFEGKNKLSDVVYFIVFQGFGASVAFFVSTHFGLNASLGFESSASFSQAASWNLLEFWFSKEVLAIYFYWKFVTHMKISSEDMACSVKCLLLISLAFMIGGEGIAFFPGHLFASGWSAFLKESTYAVLFQQVWATFLVVLCEKVNDMY